MRFGSIVLVIFVLLVLVGAWYLQKSASLLTTPVLVPSLAGGVETAFSEIGAGDHSTVNVREDYLITSQDELLQLWQLTDALSAPSSIDFKKYDVIGVFAGQKPTAGYAINVTGVVDTASERVVLVTITQPGPSCVLAQSATSPYEILELPKTALPYGHKDTIQNVSCIP